MIKSRRELENEEGKIMFLRSMQQSSPSHPLSELQEDNYLDLKTFVKERRFIDIERDDMMHSKLDNNFLKEQLFWFRAAY